MDFRYQLSFPVRNPETSGDHQRNLDHVTERFNRLPYGSGVFQQGLQPTDNKYWPAKPGGAPETLFIQPDKITSDTAPIKLIDIRNNPFTAVQDNYLVVEQGGWWQFNWVTQLIGPPNGINFFNRIVFERNSTGPPFPNTWIQIGEDWGTDLVSGGGSWPIANQTVVRLLEPGTRVRLTYQHSNGAALGAKVLSFTARLILDE